MTVMNVQTGNVTIDSCEGVPLLTVEASDGKGNVVDVYLDEDGATYLAWKLALTLGGLTTNDDLRVALDSVLQVTEG